MAIYYIDPHTTTNGTGTWASPWSLGTATRTGLADNDEIRIKGVALTSLLTATSYTATITNNYQLTITAGGGLGADFVVGDVVYIPSLDVFFKVVGISGNVINGTTNPTAFLPITNTTQIGTSITVRRVDTATYGISSTGTSYDVIGSSTKNNITISDCWTSETTRVTDGTVKTLINTSGSSAITFYVDSSASGSQCTNVTANLENTHVMATVTTNSRLLTRAHAKNSTYTINQLWQGANATYGLVYGISTSLYSTNITMSVKHTSNMLLTGATSYGNNITCTIDTFINSVADQPFGGSTAFQSIYNFTVNLGTVVATGLNYGAFVWGSGFKNTIVNFNGPMDLTVSSSPSYQSVVYATANPGKITVTFGSSFIVYYNKRASTLTSRTLTAYCNCTGNFNSAYVYSPDLNLPSGWSCTSHMVSTPFGSGATSYSGTVMPNVYTFSLPSPKSTDLTYQPSGGNNVICIYRDGSSPVESLGPFGNGDSTVYAKNYLPSVTTDASVYRTTGPSIKSYLQTVSSSTFPTQTTKARKPIKIPVTSGTSYTVTGYIRCNDTAYVNGDCTVSVFFNETELDSQSMTTSCINAWEQFTLTFTATQTGEALFTWDMFYVNGDKSYWLDDLTVS